MDPNLLATVVDQEFTPEKMEAMRNIPESQPTDNIYLQSVSTLNGLSYVYSKLH